jgi:hypothetical protein
LRLSVENAAKKGISNQMGPVLGDILTPLLIVFHIVWDKIHGNFRGLWLQIVGAIFAGWAVNLIFNANSAPMNPAAPISIVALLTFVFYIWAFNRRRKS